MSKYSEAGVDLSKGQSVKDAIKRAIKSTYDSSVLSAGGEFGGIYRLPGSNQLVVASIDGVGTKLKVAVRASVHGTIGEDLVNHCINDIAVMGASPALFLDYFATGELEESVVLQVIEGIVRGCRQSGIALLGGETAQMPDIYQEGEYDLAGAIFGFMEEQDRLPLPDISPGDALVGFTSNGLHTNGYSLARKVVFEDKGLKVDSYQEELGLTWGEELLRVHKPYLREIRELRTDYGLKAAAHITGGGILGNLDRVLPEGVSAEVFASKIPKQPVFHLLQDYGDIPDSEMYDVFNMGVGLIAILPDSRAAEVVGAYSETAFYLGQIVKDEGVGKVRLEVGS